MIRKLHSWNLVSTIQSWKMMHKHIDAQTERWKFFWLAMHECLQSFFSRFRMSGTLLTRILSELEFKYGHWKSTGCWPVVKGLHRKNAVNVNAHSSKQTNNIRKPNKLKATKYENVEIMKLQFVWPLYKHHRDVETLLKTCSSRHQNIQFSNLQTFETGDRVEQPRMEVLLVSISMSIFSERVD